MFRQHVPINKPDRTQLDPKTTPQDQKLIFFKSKNKKEEAGGSGGGSPPPREGRPPRAPEARAAAPPFQAANSCLSPTDCLSDELTYLNLVKLT